LNEPASGLWLHGELEYWGQTVRMGVGVGSAYIFAIADRKRIERI